MKIIFIISGLLTGGAEIMLFNIVSRINREEFNPIVVSLTTQGILGERIQELGIPVFALNMGVGNFNFIKSILKLIEIIKSEKPNIVHTWMYHADFIGGVIAYYCGIKTICWCIHHSNLNEKLNKLSIIILSKLCARISSIIPKKILTCSNAAKKMHISLGYDASKFVVVPNGVDIEKFKPDSAAHEIICRELNIDENSVLIGLIGRMDPLKNHEGFFEAAKYIHDHNPQAVFILAGKDVTEKNEVIERSLSKYNLRNVTHLLGLRSDISRIISGLDILVSSSMGEAFPNVIVEAMSCGVPCAVTNVGDSAFIVGNYGYVVNSGDMVGLANSIMRFLDLTISQRKEIGIQCRKRIVEEFEMGEIVRKYENFYKSSAPLVTIL
jgi:glycosyltransferase involved in cell wall biosynthesis